MSRLLCWLAVSLLLASPATVDAQDAGKKGKDWRGKDLQKRDLQNENLEGAILDEANLSLANLKDVNAQGASFRGADLTGASLDGANLSGTDFREATLTRASFQRANLSKANCEGLDLAGASLQQADLRGANLKKIKGVKDITRADLRNADLRGANLLGAVDYSGNTARFQGARFDKNTRWPKGFDVEGSGAVLTESDKDPPASEPKRGSPGSPDPKPAGADKELDPNRPKDAPSEKEVKALLEKRMWAPPQQGGTQHTYLYKSLKYGPPRKGEFRTDGVPANKETTVYPVKVAVEILRTFTDGTTQTEQKKQTYVFFKDEFGDWTFRFKSND